MRKDAQIEMISNENAAMKRRLKELEQANRSNNVILFNILEEKPGARLVDSVQTVFEKLLAQDIPTEMPTSCMRIGSPRSGPAARPRPIKAIFSSGDTKHLALKRGKDIRAKGFGVDINLTPNQQLEHNLKRNRFVALKEQNEHVPLLEGCQAVLPPGRPGEGRPWPQATHSTSSQPSPQVMRGATSYQPGPHWLYCTIVCSGRSSLGVFQPPQAQVLCLEYQWPHR